MKSGPSAVGSQRDCNRAPAGMDAAQEQLPQTEEQDAKTTWHVVASPSRAEAKWNEPPAP